MLVRVQQMQQGRRTASLKASYEAVSKSVELTKELALGREYAAAASSRSAQASSAADNVSTTKTSSSRSKKWEYCDVVYYYYYLFRIKMQHKTHTYESMYSFCAVTCWLGGRKSIQPVKHLTNSNPNYSS